MSKTFNPFTDEVTEDDGAADAAMLAEDANAQAGDALVGLFALVAEMQRAEQAVEAATRTLAETVAAYKDIAERRLPDAMERAKQESFPYKDLRTGVEFTVHIDRSNFASIACEHKAKANSPPCDECRSKAHAFLIAKDRGGVIKRDIFASVGLMSEEVLNALVARLEAAAPELELALDERVEPATFKATVNELIKAGVSIDASIKVTPQRAAKLRAKPKRRSKA